MLYPQRSGGETRTLNPLINSQMLSPIELPQIFTMYIIYYSKNKRLSSLEIRSCSIASTIHDV